MEIRINGRHEIKTTDTLKEFITDRLGKLEKFYDKITSCHVVIDSESLDKVVEIVLNCRGHTVKALAKAENVGKAVDGAIDKAERQLVKINAKIKSHKGRQRPVESPRSAEDPDIQD